ncbi:Putative survival motor neuron protein oligomerization [Colletotrichum destructivum]|uniref:Survival motor neuron protein oligomerization n=1 Tax=Colletotrichum destructivum TaxID=34406 RepID=A0AAX4IEF4_9PEZI|nr:Putative survival motor neuron protein oligomerization [Colletotrichum destructivum]
MADNDMEMTHAEMWDDSALIDSWNEALDEYKASGPLPSHGRRWFPSTLDAQLQAVDQPEIVPGTEGASKTEVAGNSTEVKQPLDPSGNPGRSEKLGSVLMHLVQNDSSDVPIAKAVSGHGGNGLGPATMGPQSLLGTVQDEGLKKLLMSWYYAGYYTGLYEGQQQQQQAK